MDQSSPQRPRSKNAPEDATIRPAGKVSEYVGSRLLLIGLMARVLGFGLLAFAGIELWLVVTRGTLGSRVVPLVIAGSLAFALQSIGASATKTGLKYLHGHKSLAQDAGTFVARRIQRRRTRGR